MRGNTCNANRICREYENVTSSGGTEQTTRCSHEAAVSSSLRQMYVTPMLCMTLQLRR